VKNSSVGSSPGPGLTSDTDSPLNQGEGGDNERDDRGSWSPATTVSDNAA